ncbi:MAG: TetR family transcriptional regulator [Oscillospiraceae bacterium]|nr:TetR family transcriptional regulator [Oscillospiraceae bacterium]
MIKQTYYNLPNDKKERILKGIISEIDKYDFEDISINRIVHTAQISRGSFYQYFDNKTDLFHLILEDFRLDMYNACKSALNEAEGDLIAACKMVFDYVVEVSAKQYYASAFKTVFSFTNYNSQFLIEKSCPQGEPIIQEIMQLVNKDLLNIDSENDIEVMLEIIGAVLCKSWFEIFVMKRDAVAVKNKLDHMLLLMKNGFYRR